MLQCWKSRQSLHLSQRRCHPSRRARLLQHSRLSLLSRRCRRDGHQRHCRLWRRSPHAFRQHRRNLRSPPIKIEFIEIAAKKSTSSLGKLEELAGTGLIEIAGDHGRQTGPVHSAKRHRRRPSQDRGQGADDAHLSSARTDRWHDKPLYKAIVEAMRANDIAGVTVYRGILGYGAHRRVHKDKPLRLSRDASIVLSVVDTEEKLQPSCPSLIRWWKRASSSSPMSTSSNTPTAPLKAPPTERHAMKEEFRARMLRIHFGENDRWQGKPLHEAIVVKCKELGIEEVIVFRGIEGYGSSTRIRHSSHWKFSKDAPIQVSVIDTEERYRAAHSLPRSGRRRRPRRYFHGRRHPLRPRYGTEVNGKPADLAIE